MGVTQIRASRLMLYISGIETLLLAVLFYAGLATLVLDKFPLSQAWEAAILSLHISMAMLVAFFAAAMLMQAQKEGIKTIYYLALLNIVFIGIAAAGGLAFYGTLTPDSSYLMALGFFGALFCSSACMFYSI
jgi:hypothetical protein